MSGSVFSRTTLLARKTLTFLNRASSLSAPGPGTWFCEMTVLENENADAHVRLGWSQELGALQGPCGGDEFSYSYADKNGCAFHRR